MHFSGHATNVWPTKTLGLPTLGALRRLSPPKPAMNSSRPAIPRDPSRLAEPVRGLAIVWALLVAALVTVAHAELADGSTTHAWQTAIARHVDSTTPCLIPIPSHEDAGPDESGEPVAEEGPEETSEGMGASPHVGAPLLVETLARTVVLALNGCPPHESPAVRGPPL